MALMAGTTLEDSLVSGRLSRRRQIRRYPDVRRERGREAWAVGARKSLNLWLAVARDHELQD